MPRARLIGFIAVASAVAVVLPTVAASQSGDVPGLAQYTEMLPTVGGGESATANSQAHLLRPSIQAELDRIGGPTSVSLRVIATSGAFGAPQANSSNERPAAAGDMGFAAAASRGTGHGSVIAVIALVVILSAAAVAARRRSSA
jgi:hypothetical protein